MPYNVIQGLRRPSTPAEQLWEFVKQAPYEIVLGVYQDFWKDPKTKDRDRAQLGQLDRYFLLIYLLRRSDVIHPWIYERCREVETNRDGYLDLWARYHYKSTLITFAGSIQEVLSDPEIKIAIFSVTKAAAMPHFRQIKEELESNELLKRLYPNILYLNPARESPKWSDEGIIVRRRGNPKEPTVSAYGLTEALPTGMHFELRLYDDVVTEKSVTGPGMIEKTTSQLELSYNLGTVGIDREQFVGTRYKFGDTYQHIEKTGSVKIRRYPATGNGKIDGDPVFMSREKWEELKRKTRIHIIACQQLLDPLQGTDKNFDIRWVRYYEVRPLTLNVYIMVDPARTKKKSSDNTGIAVVGTDYAMNKYLLDGLCHKLSLSERWKALKHFRSKWMRAPGVQAVWVGYEKYGAEADLDHFEEEMKKPNEPTFPIKKLTWTKADERSHIDRVQRLEPDLKNWSFFFPYSEQVPGQYDDFGRPKYRKTQNQANALRAGSDYLVAKPIIQKNQDGELYDLVEWMIKEEFLYFPEIHVDFLDCLSRFYDMEPVPPVMISSEDLLPQEEPAY